MKSPISKLLLAAMFFLLPSSAGVSFAGVQTDPALTGAIGAQCELLKQIFKKRDNTQKKIITAEASVATAMDRMHHVEEQVLNYMSNVQSAFRNLYQIKRAGELVAVDIPYNMKLVKQAVGEGHLQGTVIGTMCSTELVKITNDMMTLYPFLSQLVTSGSYTTESYDENGNVVQTKNKVNLLDAAERYWILDTILGKLYNIRDNLWCLAWNIRCMGYKDMLYALDPEGWLNYMTGKSIANSLVDDWNYNLKYM